MISVGSDSSGTRRDGRATSAGGATIALADCRWVGHHPTYFRAMCGALLKAGYRVIAICPAPDECDQFIRDDFADHPEAISRFHAVLFQDPRPVIPLERFDHDPVSTRRRWRELMQAIEAGQKGSGWKVDFVFFSWLDSFLRFAGNRFGPDRLGIPWSGLYFRNHHLLQERGLIDSGIRMLKGDRLLGHPGCRALGLLDERPAPRIAERYGVEPVLFPDITNGSLPDQPTALARTIRQKAGDRFVLGMISLEPRKGVIEMLRAAEAGRDRPWYWVFAGPFEERWFSGDELALIHRLKREADSGTIDHLHLDLSGARIPDGDEYNGLFNAFDAVLAVYPGWEASSNALTKAALFEKPVLAWDGGCVGQRVREFEMGLTIDPDDVPGILRAVESLSRGTGPEGAPLRSRFADYRRLHSIGQLQKSLVRVIEISLAGVAAKRG